MQRDSGFKHSSVLSASEGSGFKAWTAEMFSVNFREPVSAGYIAHAHSYDNWTLKYFRKKAIN